MAEDDKIDTIRPRLDAAGADCTKILIFDAVKAQSIDGKSNERCFDLSRDVERLEKACRTENAVLVIMDPISAYLGKGKDSHNNADVRGLLAPLAALAAKCSAAVVAVTHDKKGGGSAGERTLGSVAFVAAPRAVWAVTPETSDTGEPTARNILTRIKGNLGSDPGGLAYEIEAYRIGSESEPDGIGTSRVKWHDGAIVKTADQLYAASTADRGGRKRDARERDDTESLLRELLAGGRMPVKEIEAEAKSAGISWATVRRARGMVGAISVKAGFSPAVWYWMLPVGVPETPKVLTCSRKRRG